MYLWPLSVALCSHGYSWSWTFQGKPQCLMPLSYSCLLMAAAKRFCVPFNHKCPNTAYAVIVCSIGLFIYLFNIWTGATHHVNHVTRADYCSTSTLRKGVYGPITSLRTRSLRPPQGPDVRLPKIVTSQQGLWLVLSQKPDAEPKPVHDCIEASAWSLRCVDVEP